MPSDVVLKTVNRLQRVVMRLTGDRLGWRAMGMPVLELTTTGRRSGRPRTVLLTAPLHEGASFVVVASRGGDDAHPSWYLNLRDEPAVRVGVRGRSQPMHARVLADAERAAAWRRIVERFPHYGRYQDRTARQLPLVRLEPAS